MVEVIGQEEVGYGDVLGLPVLEFIVEGDYLRVHFYELGKSMESIEFQLEEVEERVKVFGFIGEFDDLGLGGKLHFLAFEIPVVLVAVLRLSLLHSMNKIIIEVANIT